MADKPQKELTSHVSNDLDDGTSNQSSKPDERLTEFKQSLTKDGHLEEREGQVSYVAKDFMKMLKIGGGASPNRKSDVPSINPGMLDKLEEDCIRLNSSVDTVITELTNHLHTISAVSVANSQICASKINNVNKAVDGSVHAMYSLIAQCEEIDQAMKAVYKLAEKISNLKDVVSTLETHIH